MWPMTVKMKLFPSSDSPVRKVEVKRSNENKTCTFVRPIVDLVPLVLLDDQ
jgi:hypothetical protein